MEVPPYVAWGVMKIIRFPGFPCQKKGRSAVKISNSSGKKKNRLYTAGPKCLLFSPLRKKASYNQIPQFLTKSSNRPHSRNPGEIKKQDLVGINPLGAYFFNGGTFDMEFHTFLRE